MYSITGVQRKITRDWSSFSVVEARSHLGMQTQFLFQSPAVLRVKSYNSGEKRLMAKFRNS